VRRGEPHHLGELARVGRSGDERGAHRTHRVARTRDADVRVAAHRPQLVEHGHRTPPAH
jgi:hypothetical protein